MVRVFHPPLSPPTRMEVRIETGERTSHIRVNFCNAFDIDRMVIDELSISRIGAAVSRTLDDYEVDTGIESRVGR